MRDKNFVLVWSEATSSAEYGDKECEQKHIRQRIDYLPNAIIFLMIFWTH